MLPNMAKKKDRKTTLYLLHDIFLQSMQCSLLCLSFLPCSVAGQPRVFHPLLVSVLFTGPSLHDFNFNIKFLPLVSFLFVVCLGKECCHVKNGNTANSPNKMARHAVDTCCIVKGCNIAYTYLYMTAANEAHLPKKFTIHEMLGGYLLINCQYTKFFFSTQRTNTALKLLEQLDNWIDILGSRLKVIVHFYLQKICIICSVVVVSCVVQW